MLPPHVPPHWKIILADLDDADHGDVLTQDGEIVGKWSCDELKWYQFFPDGEAKPVVQGASVGLFCFEIAEWFDGR